MHVAIGLMSGTSMDGIDVALLRTNGKNRIEHGPSAAYPYKAKMRRKIASALEQAQQITERSERPGKLGSLEKEITERHAEAVTGFLAENKLRLSDIDLIGFHGQTVLHRPVEGITVQLGDCQMLADETGLPVVGDLRANDMANGGQGAPLVPVYHRALARNLPAEYADRWPIAFINIGGIANISWISKEGGLVAFDTGPGNALIDQWVQDQAGIPFDQGAAIASEGHVIHTIAEEYLASPYFTQPGPKSLDRNDFAPLAADRASLEDGARTLAYVTAASIAKALQHLPERPRLYVLCGGGSRNPAIVKDLRVLLGTKNENDGEGEPRVILATDAGFDGDMIEAEAWAYLAVRAARGLKITWPHTTGVHKPISGGRIFEPAGYASREKVARSA